MRSNQLLTQTLETLKIKTSQPKNPDLSELQKSYHHTMSDAHTIQVKTGNSNEDESQSDAVSTPLAQTKQLLSTSRYHDSENQKSQVSQHSLNSSRVSIQTDNTVTVIPHHKSQSTMGQSSHMLSEKTLNLKFKITQLDDEID